MTTRRPLTIALALALATLLALPASGLAANDTVERDRAATDAATDRRPIDRVTDRRPATRTETFQIGRIGVVQITWARTGIVDVDVRARRGWRHETGRNGRNTVRVVFTKGEVAVVFTAHVTPDGTLRTATHRRHLDHDAATDAQRRRILAARSVHVRR